MSEHTKGVDSNPYMEHGIGFSGFCHNLQLGSPQACGALFHKAYEPERLAAIRRQADNIHDAAVSGMKAVGTLLAVVVASGELPENTVSDAGWLIEFLAGIAADTSVFSANAAHTLEHGALLSTI